MALSPTDAFSLAQQLVDQGLDVYVDVRHSGEMVEDSNVVQPPSATVRISTPDGQPMTPAVLALITEHENASVASSDLLIG